MSSSQIFRHLGASVLAGALLFAASPASAKPTAGEAFCEVYSDAPACTQGAADCVTCHTVPPARTLYGAQVEANLLPDEERPLTDDLFLSNLPAALEAAAELDADGDGFANLAELMAGSNPSDGNSVPADALECAPNGTRPAGLDVCAYDPVYVYKKVMLDFCGVSPTYDELKDFEANGTTDKLHDVLDGCLDTDYWRGKDGVLWNLANSKIQPIQAIKSGPVDKGPIPLADYFDDYNYFVYVTSDDRDARELLTGDYFVERSGSNPTVYQPFQRTPLQDYNERGFEGAQAVARQYRAGMITHRWFLMSNTMFTSIPRTTAAQAYRAYLGLDISRLEGLSDIDGEPADYDNKGVQREECAVCHATLDPLTYPFASYEGIGGGSNETYVPFSYNSSRLARFVEVDGESILETPEAGYIFGQRVENLVEWADVAANSDPFAQSLVNDFWELLIGEEPRPNELQEFEGLWRRFMSDHEYRVEAMLHDLITTEAYGVP